MKLTIFLDVNFKSGVKFPGKLLGFCWSIWCSRIQKSSWGGGRARWLPAAAYPPSARAALGKVKYELRKWLQNGLLLIGSDMLQWFHKFLPIHLM